MRRQDVHSNNKYKAKLFIYPFSLPFLFYCYLKKMINSSSTLTDSTKFEDVHEKQTRKDSCEDSVGVYFDTNAKVDRAEEKKLVRKLDLRIMPLFCLFYFADFLDRANIGNAA